MVINMNLKIILAEDNRMERKNIEYVLNSIPECEIVASFPDGQQVLDYLRENEADILIADIQMPVLNGVDLVRKIVDENIDVEKIVISAYSEFDYAQKLIDCDVISYVMKPFADNEFEDAVEKAVKTRLKKKEKECKIRNMMVDYEKMRPVFVDNFFRNLILMPNNNREYIEKNEKTLNLELIGKYKTIISVSILNGDSELDFGMYSVLMDIISGSSTEGITCYPLMISENEITVIAIHDRETNPVAFAIELKNTIVEKCAVNVFIGVSNTARDIARLNVLYNQSRSLIKNHLGNYKNVVIAYNSVDDCENEHNLSMDALQFELRNIVIDGDTDGCEKLLRKYIDTENSKVWLRNFTVCYINILEIILNEAGDGFDNLIGNEKVWLALAKFDSIVNLEQWLYNLTAGVIFQLKNSNLNERTIANKVVKLVEERYNEKISVKFIADKLGFSREYLHRVFARVTGQSVLEYLTDYRVNKAKEFLSKGKDVTTTMEMVGYSDKSHFTRVFKSRVGMTPAEFKNK